MSKNWLFLHVKYVLEISFCHCYVVIIYDHYYETLQSRLLHTQLLPLVVKNTPQSVNSLCRQLTEKSHLLMTLNYMTASIP